MGALATALSSYGLIGIDSSPFIYLLEDYPEFSDAAFELFDELAASRASACTSVVTLAEVLVPPFRLGLLDIARNYQATIVGVPNLTIVDIDASIATESARLRGIFRLRTPDSLQLAACMHAGAEVFVTNDRQLQRVSEIPVLLLSDFASG